MIDVVRRPTLDDYDRGNGGVFWAESIGAAAHPAYDRYELCEYVPTARSAVEAKADAGAAEVRYQAHRERARVEEIEARKYREAAIKLQKERQAKRAEEYSEQQRAIAAHAAERQQAARDAAERRARWEAENAEWIAEERRKVAEAAHVARRKAWEEHERKEALAKEQAIVRAAQWAAALQLQPKTNPALLVGAGRHVVQIVNKNVNIGSSIRLEIGEYWFVGDYWGVQLVGDGYAVLVASQ